MRFALLGSHPDGLAFARALVATGRHELIAFTTTLPFDVGRLVQPVGATKGPGQRPSDLEEILADPAIEAIIVAGPLADRPALLRRSLQSERHVFCVHPADERPEIAYEAGMIRQDVRCVLLPLLSEGLHPAVRRFAEFIDQAAAASTGPVGRFRLLTVERAAIGAVLTNVESAGSRPSFPGWDMLRRLGGEVAEVSAFARDEELEANAVVMLAGRFERGGLFQTTLVPNQPDDRWRLTVIGERGRAELTFPQGWAGPAQLGWHAAAGAYQEEYWDRWDPWPTMVAECEVKDRTSSGALDWHDEVRALELDDAARRSVQKRRTSLLEYPEANEEVGFKGTMTLIGCGMLWAMIALLIASVWVPLVGWLIVPLLVVFLVLQLLRYAVPAKDAAPPTRSTPGRG